MVLKNLLKLYLNLFQSFFITFKYLLLFMSFFQVKRIIKILKQDKRSTEDLSYLEQLLLHLIPSLNRYQPKLLKMLCESLHYQTIEKVIASLRIQSFVKKGNTVTPFLSFYRVKSICSAAVWSVKRCRRPYYPNKTI